MHSGEGSAEPHIDDDGAGGGFPPAALPQAAPAGCPVAQAAVDEVREARATIRRLVNVIEADGRYPVDAYRFLQEALDRSVKRVHGPAARSARPDPAEADAPPRRRRRRRREGSEDLRDHPHHVSGRQLCDGLADLAVERYGRMARAVLAGWNIHATRDFGEMVFVLVDNDFLQKTDGDRVEDFEDVFPLRRLEEQYAVPAPALLDAEEVHATESST